MKRLLIACLALGITSAYAQAPAAPAVEQPKPKCEEPGAYPGRVGMQTDDRRNRFLKSVENYKTCMLAFVEERKAVINANQEAAKSAIEAFNNKMKALNEEQSKATN